MEIRAKDIRMVPISEIKLNPGNRNQHPEEQIEHLMMQFRYQGFRTPLVISNRSGLLVAGHGRVEAAKRAGLTELPVVYQDFESDEQEYAFGVADNSTAHWSGLDFSGINSDLPDLGPDFDISLLGIKDFKLEALELGMPELPEEDKPDFKQVTFILHNDQAAEVDRAIELAKSMGEFVESKNLNSNGNALARVCEMFLGANGNS